MECVTAVLVRDEGPVARVIEFPHCRASGYREGHHNYEGKARHTWIDIDREDASHGYASRATTDDAEERRRSVTD